MSAQKGLEGFEMEIRELLGGSKENNILSEWVIYFPSRAKIYKEQTWVANNSQKMSYWPDLAHILNAILDYKSVHN